MTEALPNGTYRAELTNGHRLTAFVAGKAKKQFAGLKSGDKVTLQLTPYDLSTGRVIAADQWIGGLGRVTAVPASERFKNES